MDSGTNSQIAAIYELQNKIQFDEPANIQFTSVRRLSPLLYNSVKTT